MSVWAIYVIDADRAEAILGFRPAAGELIGVVQEQPAPGSLLGRGFSCTYFGEDMPDGAALEWSPAAHSFVARGGRQERERAAPREPLPGPIIRPRWATEKEGGNGCGGEGVTNPGSLTPSPVPPVTPASPWWRRLCFWRRGES